MGVRLQRHLGPVGSLEPAQWTFETASGSPAICCPGCGGVSDVDDLKAIDSGGRITPAWSCPTVTCPFFDYVTLEGWAE